MARLRERLFMGKVQTALEVCALVEYLFRDSKDLAWREFRMDHLYAGFLLLCVAMSIWLGINAYTSRFIATEEKEKKIPDHIAHRYEVPYSGKESWLENAENCYLIANLLHQTRAVLALIAFVLLVVHKPFRDFITGTFLPGLGWQFDGIEVALCAVAITISSQAVMLSLFTQFGLKHSPNLSTWSLVYIPCQLVSFFAPLYAINHSLKLQDSPSCAFFLGAEFTCLLMKFHAFSMTYCLYLNREGAGCRKTRSAIGTSLEYFHFLLCPSLLYDGEKTPRIPVNLFKAFRELFYAVFFFLIVAYLNQYLLFPVVMQSERNALGSLTEYAVLSNCIKMAIPVTLFVEIAKYSFWYCTLHFFAFLSGFGYRDHLKGEAYSKTMSEYFRKWSSPIHDFLFRHFFCDVQIVLKLRNRHLKSVVTFFVSSILHEYFHFIALYKQCPSRVLFSLKYYFGKSVPVCSKYSPASSFVLSLVGLFLMLEKVSQLKQWPKAVFIFLPFMSLPLFYQVICETGFPFEPLEAQNMGQGHNASSTY
eukprot:Nk52_evm34s352 gene=Nk52_evmTU34s352